MNCIVLSGEVFEEKNVTVVELKKAADIASNTITRIRKNEEVLLDVLGRICPILNSDFGDIMEYEEEMKEG